MQSARNYVHCLNVMIGLGRVYHLHLPDREAESRDVVGQGIQATAVQWDWSSQLLGCDTCGCFYAAVPGA